MGFQEDFTDFLALKKEILDTFASTQYITLEDANQIVKIYHKTLVSEDSVKESLRSQAFLDATLAWLLKKYTRIFNKVVTDMQQYRGNFLKKAYPSERVAKAHLESDEEYIKKMEAVHDAERVMGLFDLLQQAMRRRESTLVQLSRKEDQARI